MNRVLCILTLAISGCAGTPPEACPALLTLPDPATMAQKDQWIAATAAQYATCAASARQPRSIP